MSLFQGKEFLDAWLPNHRDETIAILHAYPRDKIEKVYYYFLKLLQQMQWGQYFVVEKMCPRLEDRLLFNWVLEFIYQGSILADFYLRRESPTETRLYICEPPDEIKTRADILLGRRTYILVDWYSRIKRNDLDGTSIDRSILFPDYPAQPDPLSPLSSAPLSPFNGGDIVADPTTYDDEDDDII